jgi:hypothetical protein
MAKKKAAAKKAKRTTKTAKATPKRPPQRRVAPKAVTVEANDALLYAAAIASNLGNVVTSLCEVVRTLHGIHQELERANYIAASASDVEGSSSEDALGGHDEDDEEIEQAEAASAACETTEDEEIEEAAE